jgi:16S rRNA processing protein RimM
MIIYIGTILQIKGFKGEMLIGDLISDLPRLKPQTKIKIGFSEQFAKEYTIVKWTPIFRNALVKLKEIDSDKSAKELKEQGLFIDDAILKDADDGYVSFDEVIGFRVFDDDTNEYIGEISEIWETPTNNLWLVLDEEGTEIIIPVIEEFVKKIDYTNRTARIFVMEGLIN